MLQLCVWGGWCLPWEGKGSSAPSSLRVCPHPQGHIFPPHLSHYWALQEWECKLIQAPPPSPSLDITTHFLCRHLGKTACCTKRLIYITFSWKYRDSGRHSSVEPGSAQRWEDNYHTHDTWSILCVLCDDKFVITTHLLFPFCLQACEVGGYRIPEGTQVAYISYSANRDSKVFPQPDTFYPDRWTNEWVALVIALPMEQPKSSHRPVFCLYTRNAQDMGKVWTFGGGARKCIGKFLCDSILKVL